MSLFSRIITAAMLLAGSANLFATSSPNSPVTSATTQFRPGLAGDLEKIVAAHRGYMGVYLRHLGTSETVEVNGRELFPTASTIKLPVMCAAMELLAAGEGPYKSYYDTRKYDASTSTGGSGFLRNFSNGTAVELKELIHLMITVSDNIATNMICDWIGLQKVNTWLETNGFQHTRMFSTVGGGQVFDPQGRKTWGLGVTTPEEMGRLMEKIVIGKAGTTSTTEEMLRVLGHQYFDGGIPGGVPPMTYVGSKSGALNRSRSDVAVVASPAGTYILSIFTRDNEDTSWENSNEAEVAIRKISYRIWQHYNPDSTWQIPAGDDKF